MTTTGRLKELLEPIVSNDSAHAKWLNSLSMMENTGARKISKYEDPRKVTEIILKHAAEEARHAWYLKKMIVKLPGQACPDYTEAYLLAPVESHQYLNLLDVEVCRFLKNKFALTGRALKHGAYLLVTYAIEVRADELYGDYQAVLSKLRSKVSVKSIIAEEEGHLREMRNMLESFHPEWETIAEEAIKIENRLFDRWIDAVELEMKTQKQPEIA